jgi:hypothetical protein
MQRRLVVPDLAVKPVAVQTKRCFGHLEPFIRANLNRSPQRNPALKKKKRNEQDCRDGHRRRP